MKGPALLLAGIISFSLCDASGKLLSAIYGPAQVITIRYLVLLALLFALRAAWPGLGGPLPTRQLRTHLARGSLMFISAGCFYMGFRRVPLAEGYLVFFLGPFLTLALTAWLTKERVPRAAWAWSLLGFAGVALAVSSKLVGGGSAVGYLYVCIGTTTFALTQLANRELRHETGVARLLFYPALIGLGGYGLPALLNWVPPPPLQALTLAANGLLAAGGIACTALAYRVADAARLGPFGFAALPTSVALDWLIWHHPPEALTILGGIIVVVACVMSERSRRQAIPAGKTCSPSAPSGSGVAARTAETGNAP